MNMILDTEQCNRIANALANLKQSQAFEDPGLQAGHARIQSQISLIENFFRRLATMVENNETGLIESNQIYTGTHTGLVINSRTTGSVGALAKGRTFGAIGELAYTGILAQSAKSIGPFFGEAAISGIEGDISGEASFRLTKGKQLYPELKVQVQGDAHLAAAKVAGGVDAGLVAASIGAAGEVGAVYGDATAIFSPDQQVLSAQVGAAAVRGECTLAIEVANIRVTIAVTGSLGSVEAGFHYANEPGSWEIGANGALFAGTGLRIRVDY